MWIYRLCAEVLFAVHFVLIVIALFGWIFPVLTSVYLATLLGTLISNLWLERCILSDYEFALRNLYDPAINYNHSYSSYYTYKLTKQHLGDDFLRITGLLYTSTALLIWGYFHL